MKNIQILLNNGISALAFSKNGAYCIIATKDNVKAYIFEIKTLNDINSWTIIQQIKDHGQTISDIDWSLDEKIITVSHDRSVYVWKRNKQLWEKMLVNVEVKLSILSAKWSPNSKKFAIASCPSNLLVSCYTPEQQFWTTAFSKQKLCSSPIVSLDFHPSNNIMVVGQVNGSVKLVTCNFRKSAELAKLDEFQYNGPFDKIDTFGQVLYSIDRIFENMNVWINHVSFENNGKQLLVIPHSSHIKVFDVVEGQKNITNERDVSYKGLPFINGFLNVEKNELVLAGHDRKVAKFNKQGQSYKFDKYLDANEKTNKKKAKGIVEMFAKGIEKKEWQFGNHPKEDEHKNIIKVIKTRNNYISYDINGIVHFWQ